MAFTVQFSNNTRIQHYDWRNPQFRKDLSTYDSGVKDQHKVFQGSSHRNMYGFTQKIGHVTPTLCFQSDVFYPNALAAVLAQGEDVDYRRNLEGSQQCATGCRGHQIQKDFPLDSRLPVAVPLVQYPTPASNKFLDEMDLCAAPVLNWQKYVEEVKHLVATTKCKDRVIPRFKSLTERQKMTKKAYKLRTRFGHLPEDQRPKMEEIETSDSDDKERIIPYSSSEEGEEGDSDEEGEGEGGKERKLKDICKPKLKRKSKKLTKAYIKQKLFEVGNDERKKKGKRGKVVKSGDNVLRLGYLKNLPHKARATSMSRPFLATVKGVPPFHLQATWNYLYGGAGGACCHTAKGENITVFAGCRTQVRQAVLEKGMPASMLSYKLNSVWEEDTSSVPVNTRKYSQAFTNPLSDAVLELVVNRKANILGARRGKSVDIYSIEEGCPYLVDEIPNKKYGKMPYRHCGATNSNIAADPSLLGLDFNPLFAAEALTIDENMTIRICDYSQGETVNRFGITKRKRVVPSWPGFPYYHFINDAAGAQFHKDGQGFYAWSDSNVYVGDRRNGRLMDIFDLRRSISSLSLSDQVWFNDTQVELNEYMSSLIPSEKENYFYVGTTGRIFLMDMRVPAQPVLKLEHGMPVAAYLDSYFDGSFEILASGSQRQGTTFMAITDHAHVQCFDRKSCVGLNPILQSLPRQWSNSWEFYDAVCARGCEPVFEADHQRAKAHNEAWTTGLTIMKNDRKLIDAKKPSGVFLFTSNCYGDVFYQEFEQIPIDGVRKTGLDDYKFTGFIQSWKSSIESSTKDEFLKPSLAKYVPIDCSLLVETCAHEVKCLPHIRTKTFNAKEPNHLVHNELLKTQVPFETRLKELREYKADIAQRCLDFWEYNGVDAEPLTVKLEEPDYTVSLDASAVQFLCEKEIERAIVDLEAGEQQALQQDESSGESETSVQTTPVFTSVQEVRRSPRNIRAMKQGEYSAEWEASAVTQGSELDSSSPYRYGDPFTSSQNLHSTVERKEEGGTGTPLFPDDTIISEDNVPVVPTTSRRSSSQGKSQSGFH